MTRMLTQSILLFALLAAAPTLADSPDAHITPVLDKYHSALPAERDLAVYRLDWVETLDEAKRKAAREQRPILLIVVTNSYGNLYTGHC